MNTVTAPPERARTFRKIYAAIALAMLAVPLVAMQFSNEVHWQAGDFAMFAAMLVMLGIAIEIAIRFARNRWIRTTAIGLSVAGFLLVWGALAT